MLKNLNLKNYYTTKSSDILNDFFAYVFKETNNYDRATGNFSFNTLKLYSRGLEYFQFEKGKIRFIMFHEIQKNEFDEMISKKNHDIQSRIETEFWKGNLEDSREISNLAYLVESKIIDLKIAFVEHSNSIYYSKFGLIYDQENNIFFNGFSSDYYDSSGFHLEKFDITIDWLGASQREILKIQEAKKGFNKMWNNDNSDVISMSPSKLFLKKLVSFSKGEIIYSINSITNNTAILDFDGNKNLEIRFNPNFTKISENDSFYKKQIKYLVKKVWKNRIHLIENMELSEIKELIQKMRDYSLVKDFEFVVSNNLEKYIENRDFQIQKRYELGIQVKNQDKNILNSFEFFKLKINELMHRKLRDQQMWDAFFGFIMKKSFNFSVPGSGKTSVVLAIFSYLKYKNNAKRILILGPLSSFKSWRDEYYMCFAKEPKALNLSELKNSKEKNRNLKNSLFENFDLIFVNYESIQSCKDSIREILNDTFVVLDESHYVKSNKGIRSKLCVDLFANVSNMILLTGTPIPNGIADLYMQLKILYNQEYNSFFRWDYKDLKKMTDIKLFNEKIFPFFCRTTKKDLSIPIANEHVLKNILMTEEEENLFKFIYNKIGNKNPLEFIIRCMQASSNPRLLKRKISEYDINALIGSEDNNEEKINKIKTTEKISNLKFMNDLEFSSKFLECINFIKEKSNDNKSVILWCVFIDTMNDFENALWSRGISCKIINGLVKSYDREEIISDFQNKKFSVLIANPSTIAESVSLHKNCHDAIYYEFSYNLTHLIQSKDRIHRLGLKDNDQTNYYFFSLVNNIKNSNSIDSIIYDKLMEKEKIMIDVIESKDILITPVNTKDLKEIIKDMIYK